MSEPTLEARVAALERTLTDVQRQLNALAGEPKPEPWWERVGHAPMTDEERKAFDEMVEYGRYFRKTGREAPPDWKPGDPIPEPDFDE
jgi:hypothetical protein